MNDFQEYRWLVFASSGKRQPEALIGEYRTEFEATAVADAWNRVNGKYGIKYRVEEDV
jgi:hypothetical protein